MCQICTKLTFVDFFSVILTFGSTKNNRYCLNSYECINMKNDIFKFCICLILIFTFVKLQLKLGKKKKKIKMKLNDQIHWFKKMYLSYFLFCIDCASKLSLLSLLLGKAQGPNLKVPTYLQVKTAAKNSD